MIFKVIIPFILWFTALSASTNNDKSNRKYYWLNSFDDPWEYGRESWTSFFKDVGDASKETITDFNEAIGSQDSTKDYSFYCDFSRSRASYPVADKKEPRLPIDEPEQPKFPKSSPTVSPKRIKRVRSWVSCWLGY